MQRARCSHYGKDFAIIDIKRDRTIIPDS